MKIGYIGQEIEILDPDSFRIVPFELSKKVTMASGRTVKEIIAIKNNFILNYDAMSPDDINPFIEIFTNNGVVNFIYEDRGITKNAIVSIAEIPRDLFVYDWQYSENVTISLEEV